MLRELGIGFVIGLAVAMLIAMAVWPKHRHQTRCARCKRFKANKKPCQHCIDNLLRTPEDVKESL